MNNRPHLLVVDDDPAVRAAYQRLFGGDTSSDAAQAARAALFDEEPAAETFAPVLTLVDQGDAAVAAAQAATARGEPFAVAFVDMRMPPGMNGMSTAEKLWAIDPDLQVVIASAYSDTPWNELVERLGHTDRLLFLKKPFDPIEAQQLALALTRKRQLLDAAHRRQQELERSVDDRTRDLEAALVAAQDATRAKQSFLTNMSHEIRTPLTAMLGFTDLLRDPNVLPADRESYLDIVDRNGNHLLALVNEVLDLSKLEASQVLLEVAPIDVAAVACEVGSMLRHRAIEKGLAFEVEFHGRCPATVPTDAMRLRQILLNLVGNALKFTETGSVRLVVAMGRTNDGAAAMTFRVRDTGIGIPSDLMGRLFQPFEQMDASTARRFGGTGLGLSISQRLANLMGGHIDVSSKPGHGSTFTLTLPAGDLTGVPMLDPVCKAQEQAGAPTATKGLHARVLLAEDGADNQRLLTTILRRVGAEVATASDGQGAIALARQSQAEGKPFDVILMDMQMPLKDGYTATRELRAAGWTGPIIALTAHAMEGDRERCLAAGCDGYETKPVRAQKLLAALHDHLRPDRDGGPRT